MSAHDDPSLLKRMLTWGPPIASAALGFALPYYVIGLRGLGPQGLHYLQNCRRTALALQGQLPLDTLLQQAPPHLPGAELLGAIALLTLPGADVDALRALNALAIALCCACIWGIARRYAEHLAAAIAAVCLTLASPPLLALSTTAHPAPLSLALLCASLWILSFRNQRWWRWPLLWFLGALFVLTFPPAILLALVLLMERLVRSSVYSSDSHRGGLTTSLHIPIGLILWPPMMIALASLHPALLQSDPLPAIKAWLQPLLQQNIPTTFDLGMPWGNTERLPWTWGLRMLFYRLPPILFVAAGLEIGLAAAVLRRQKIELREHNSTLRYALLILGLLLLAPIARRPDPAMTPIALLVTPPLAILAAAGILRAILLAQATLAPTLGNRRCAIGLFFGGFLLFASNFLDAARAFPYYGAYGNLISGGLRGCLDRGESLHQDDVIPIRVLEDAALAHPNLHFPAGAAITTELQKAGFLPLLQPAASPLEADAVLRALDATNYKQGEPLGLDQPRGAKRYGYDHVGLFVVEW